MDQGLSAASGASETEGGGPLSACGQVTGGCVTLANLRMAIGKTQMQVAELARMGQGDVSVLEHRRDVKLSTLNRYVGALGGRVELTVVIGDHRYIVEVGR
jgi:hypothetical protein